MIDDYDTNRMAEEILKQVKKEYNNLNKLNIMILGKTGVGKSTLINNVFSEKMADTGIGKPVTTKIRKIEKPEFPLAIYDTPGLELKGSNAIDTLLKDVIEEIEKGLNSNDIGKAIHCIWYCISATSHRFEQSEVDFLKKLIDNTKNCNTPIIVVLTQSYSKKDARTLKEEIEKENLDIVKVVPVLAENYEIDEEYTAKAFGLDMLTEVMKSVVPDAVKKTFVSVQCANFKLKKEKAQKYVNISAAAAFAIGATPIPFSDAAILIPEQITMLSKITACFGLKLEKAVFLTIISCTIGTTGASVLGKTIVTGLLKCIPGVGSVVGGAISGTTAAALTAALGETYIIILSQVYKGELNINDLSSDKGKAQIKSAFISRLKFKRDKEGKIID